MILKFLISFLIFNGSLAVLFWLLVEHEAKATDRRSDEPSKAHDRRRDHDHASKSLETGATRQSRNLASYDAQTSETLPASAGVSGKGRLLSEAALSPTSSGSSSTRTNLASPSLTRAIR